jgi:hypothetical protein
MYKTPGLLAEDKFVYSWRVPQTFLEVPPAYTSADSKSLSA